MSNDVGQTTPYSILRTSRKVDIENELNKMKQLGLKNNRAMLLK